MAGPCLFRRTGQLLLTLTAMSTLLLFLQFQSSQVHMPRSRLRVQWRWELQDNLLDTDNNTYNNTENNSGSHLTSSLNNSVSQHPYNESLCPVYQYSAVCRVQIIAHSHSNGSDIPGARPGRLIINDVGVYSWITAPVLVLARITNECKLQEVIVWSRDNQTIVKYQTMSEYYYKLHNKSILLGAGYGHSKHFKALVDFGISSTRLKALHPTRGIYTFLGWKGYRGHIRVNMSPIGKNSCSLSSHFFLGVPFKYSTTLTTYSMALAKHPDLEQGGYWEPRDCKPRWRIAIIVPFRRREHHLHVFVENMISFLKLQNIAFNIFILEQAEPELFNRAALMNVGYLEARKLYDFGCYAFHDVDLVPEDLTNLYSCSPQPRHLVVTRSVRDYRLRKTRYFGGGIMMSPESIDRINGFPNQMFGWGGEDDAIYTRVKFSGADILRYPLEIARYVSLPHGKDVGNPHMKRKLPEIDKEILSEGLQTDGLNNINYTILDIDSRRLYTHIFVRIPGPQTPREAFEYDNNNGYNHKSLKNNRVRKQSRRTAGKH